MINDRYLKIIKEVTKFMEPHNIYVTGGFCRDTLLSIEPKDIDFSTPATPEEIEECVKNSINQEGHNRKVNSVGKKFGCLKCRVFGEEVDIVSFRTEHYLKGNRKPEVNYVKSLHEDLSRRDFTINSIVFRLMKDNRLKLIDPFNGKEDLKNGIIRSVGNPKQRFKEDPLRILRCIRFACGFNFKIEEKTLDKIKKMSIHILDISKERIVMEMDKILQSTNTRIGLELLWNTNIFKWVFPEISLQYNFNQNSKYHDFKLHEHTIKVISAIRKDTDDLNLLYAGLFHDCGKVFCRIENKKGYSNYISHEKLSSEIVLKYADYLKWSNERKNKVYDLVLNHLSDDCPLRKYDNEGKK